MIQGGIMNRLKELFLGTALMFGCNIFPMSYENGFACPGRSPIDEVFYHCDKETVNHLHSEEVLVKLKDLKFNQKYMIPNLLRSEEKFLLQQYATGTEVERREAYIRLSQSQGRWLHVFENDLFV
jgi:hypothetical protein